MELHELKAAEGSRHVRNRIGHGAATGNGKTSSRGQKDQKIRSSGKVGPGFKGEQLLSFHRLPKHGFASISRKEYAIINLDQLNEFEDGAEVTPTLLVESGVVKNKKPDIKVLGDGSLDKKLTMRAHKFSASVAEAVDTKGGAHEVI